MLSVDQAEKVSYEQFRQEWLTEIEEGELSTLERGRWFAAKLVTQWLGVTTDDEDFVICDGSGDGGIDVAYLKRADTDPANLNDNSEEGDTWYLVQSKYGAGFSGSETILIEGNKIISTLEGCNQHLAHDTQQLLQKLDLFRQQSSDADRLVLVFATTDPISHEERQALENIKIIGRERISQNFDVGEVSVHTIWEGLDDVDHPRLTASVRGHFVEQSSGLLVGTVSLSDLFDFMKAYRAETGDLNQLYEKNVRQFLGGRRKINKGIARTLNETPEKFGLYNNGITIVVSGYSKPSSDGPVSVIMNDPYIVNGCQTTKTIWEVLEPKFNPGGTGDNSATKAWRERVARGGVVTKVVRSDEAEITNITRFTNSQNSVKEQDFIALNSGFQGWAASMANEYQIFLEIQRGGEVARRAWEKDHPGQPKFDAYVNAFELIKVYGAGWLSEPGLAFGKNAPFLPNGSVFELINMRQEQEPTFGAKDLYAAYTVKRLADGIGFGRNATQPSRRQSRFLFYHLLMEILKNVILLTPELGKPTVLASDLTEAILKLAAIQNEEQIGLLSNAAVSLVDQYLTHGVGQNSAFSETSFMEVHNGDLNAFLKADNLGKQNHSPQLSQLLAITNAALNMAGGKEKIATALIDTDS